jgi:hypothetical protein
MRRGFVYFLVAVAGCAQEPLTPTPETVGPGRGEDVRSYNMTQSFELGYRWSAVRGDTGMYRSIDNYGNGIRLLSSTLTLNSKEGHGRYFDEFLLDTLGLGNDPYQSATLRLEKNGLYRYEMRWRLSNYFNPGLTVAGGLHQLDTAYQAQDHDLILLPQPKFQILLGFSRSQQNGPGLSTAQEFNTGGTALPVFVDLRQQWTEYRLGASWDWKGFRFAVRHRWEDFKDDSPLQSAGSVSAPNGIGAGSISLNQFQRSALVHGTSPGWFGNLSTRHKKASVDARMTYVNGNRGFASNEFAVGVNQLGLAASRQIAVGGSAQRPMIAGDLNLTVTPGSRLSVVNTTAVTDNRIDGSALYSEVAAGANLGATVYFRYLAVRMITNSTLANYLVSRRVGIYGGYGYTNRTVRTIEAFGNPAAASSGQRDVYEVVNRLHTGRAGVRLNLIESLTFNLEGEIGRADHPLTPISESRFHTINGRVRYRLRTLELSGAYSQIYNLNPGATLISFSSHSRNYTASASWTPVAWFSLDASYMKLHLDTVSGLAFFASASGRPQLQTGDSTLYLSQIHAGNLGMRLQLWRRADLFLGYSLTKDNGAAPSATADADPVQVMLRAVQSFPLTYQAPMGRLSVKITPKIRWNAGWQFYNYAERVQLFAYDQNFHANTGYTSVLWSF